MNPSNTGTVNVAQLSSNEIQQLKKFEQQFSSDNGQPVILIAYR